MRDFPSLAEDWVGGSTARVPRAGDRVPDLELAPAAVNPTRLFDLLQRTEHTLLLLEGEEPAADRGLDAVADLVRTRWARQVKVWRASRRDGASGTSEGRQVPDPDGRLHRLFNARKASLYLVRPDGHVGYRACPRDPVRFADDLGRVLH